MEQLWWGYKHISGTYQAKRYFSDSPHARDAVNDAYDSDFVDEVVEPFKAEGREQALQIVKERTI